MCVYVPLTGEKKKNQPKYRVIFQELMPESFHFTQVLEIAQLEDMGMEKNSTGKKKIMKSLSHCNNGHLSQWPGFL